MADLELLKKNLKSYFNDSDELSLSAFMKVENILCVLLKVSPQLNPSKAYVLLRGYQLINHSFGNEQLFLLQQLRRKFLVYASKMQWEKDFGLYMDKRYENIRLYNVENKILIKTDKDIPSPNRELHYLNNIYTIDKMQNKVSVAKAGRYKFYSGDKQTITVEIPKKFNCLFKNDLYEKRDFKCQRKKIEIKYGDLLKTALKMKNINADDYCYDVLNKNKLVNTTSQSEILNIEKIVNIVGTVGSGKSTLLKVISFYLAEQGYRAVIVLNSINEVIDYYKYFKGLKLTVSPLIGKSNQEKYSYSLLKKGEKYIDGDIARYLSAPCILNGLNDENKNAWEYNERPCYNLRSCDMEQKHIGKHRCAFFDVCPSAAMLREAEKSSIVVTTVAGLAASFIGKDHHLFLEEIIGHFDVALFDECDRIQNTLDDFFAPNTAFNDFINSQADASAVDMRKRHSEVVRNRNERRFFNLTRDAISVYDAISYNIEELIKTEKGVWRNLVTSTFSAITLIERMHCDNIDKKLEDALRLCINVYNEASYNDDLVNQLLEIIDDSCREDSHISARLNRLFLTHGIEVNKKDFRHVQLLLKVIYFDRLVHRIDDAAKSVDREVLRNNNISDFLQSRFVTQQKFLPSAPMGNIFGMMYSKSDEKLKVYRQYACGRYLMLSLPWLQVDEKGNPLGPHAILLSGSSFAPGSLQYHINVPVNYILQSSEETAEYLSKSIIRTCGATTVISGGSKDGRSKRILQLLYEIRQDIETELSKLGKILFIVNSYDEAYDTWLHTKKLLAEIKSEHKCAVLIPDNETRTDKSMLRKNELIYFDAAEEKILVAPAEVICRGYNILDKNANSAIRSIFFLVRPMSVPDDISLKVCKLNGYISMLFCNKEVDDWGLFSDEVKNEAGKFWDVMQKDSSAGLMFLSGESKKDVVATVFIMLDQIYGRSARVSDIEKIGEPPRIYFADGAFDGGRGDVSFDVLKEICDYIEHLIKTNSCIAKALYASFYKALKENVSYAATETTSDDDFYTESFND